MKLRLLKGGADTAPGRAQRAAEQPPQIRRAEDPLGPLSVAAAAGDREAQRTLLIAVGPSLLRVVRGVLGAHHGDVEDTLQEAMVALHLALVGFRGECTTLHFACRVALQTALNARRRASYRRRHTQNADPAELADLALDAGSPAQALEGLLCRNALRELLAELPPAQAEVLALHTLLGYTIEETAGTIAVPANTVRSRLRAALARLRVRLETQPELHQERP